MRRFHCGILFDIPGSNHHQLTFTVLLFLFVRKDYQDDFFLKLEKDYKHDENITSVGRNNRESWELFLQKGIRTNNPSVAELYFLVEFFLSILKI